MERRESLLLLSLPASVFSPTIHLAFHVAQRGTAAQLAEKSRFLRGRACSPYRPFSEIPESPGCVSGSAKLPEKRMHFVREKRDKPPGWRFHAGKRLSDKRDKREKSPDGGWHRERWPKKQRYKPPLFLRQLAGRLRIRVQIGDASAPSARRQTGDFIWTN